MPDFEICETDDLVYYIDPYEEGDDEIGIQEVVDAKTGEVITDDFFEDGAPIGTYDKIQREMRNNNIDSFLDSLS